MAATSPTAKADPRARDGLVAGAWAAALSGAPSTAYAVLTGRDPLEAALAAGSIALPRAERRSLLLLAGAGVHAAVSLGWAEVLVRVLPTRRTVLAGCAGGAAIAALDLGLVASRFPRIRQLAVAPQVADHLAYGAIVGVVLRRRRAIGERDRTASTMDKQRLGKALTRAINPVVRTAIDLGIAPGYAVLETTGRTSGLPRRTPVGNGLDGDTFWIVSEHGHQAAYVRNIQADPRVRVKLGRRWRAGTATVLPDDDPRARQRQLGHRINGAVVRLMGTELLTVRIDLDTDAAVG